MGTTKNAILDLKAKLERERELIDIKLELLNDIVAEIGEEPQEEVVAPQTEITYTFSSEE
jgi:hypothetical protein